MIESRFPWRLGLSLLEMVCALRRCYRRDLLTGLLLDWRGELEGEIHLSVSDMVVLEFCGGVEDWVVWW